METLAIDELKYPIGKFTFNQNANDQEMAACLAAMEELPRQVRNAVQGLKETQLNAPYREGGWNVRQVVHHLADSHMNAHMRIKLAMTEDHPTIKPYLEKEWAVMSDSLELPVEVSLLLIEALHVRLVYMLRRFTKQDLERTVFHPESKRDMSVKFLIQLYAWHGKHHTAHITSLRDRMRW